jgi:hypothetical protein
MVTFLSKYFLSSATFPLKHYILWMIYKSQYTISLFGIERTVKEFWDVPDTNTDLPYSTRKYAAGIGYYMSEFEIGLTELSGCIIAGKQYGTIVSIAKANKKSLPDSYYLSNYPNPFNGQTNFVFEIPVYSNVSLKIFDLIGRNVATVINDFRHKGKYFERWEPKNLSSGVYIAVLNISNKILTKKLIYLK